jgi:hypothetical protein
MAIKLLAFDDQLVPYFAPHKEHHNFAFVHIIQGTQISRPQFKLGEKIGAQAFQRFRGRRRLVLESGQDSCFQGSLVTGRQRPQLPVGVLGDRDLERHATSSMFSVPRPATLDIRFFPRRRSRRSIATFNAN